MSAEKESGKRYIVMEARLSSMYKSEEEYSVMKKMKGAQLKGTAYKPLFDYFQEVSVTGGVETQQYFHVSGAFHVQ